MLDLNDVYYFVKVVDEKGFAAAARALDTPKSTLSNRVARLEAHLGARLIQRSSRRFTVTDVGREFHRHAAAMLLEADAAESVVQRSLAEPSGTVRFTSSIGMSELADLVPRFVARYPGINLVQHATNRFVDLVDEGFDVGLRGHSGPLVDSSLVQRALAKTPWHLFAGPAYCERFGTPRVPADLGALAALTIGVRGGEVVWELHGPNGAVAEVAVASRMSSDDVTTLKAAAVANLGVAALPAYAARREVAQGALLRILPEWVPGDHRITLLTPSRRGQLPSVRAFIEFLVAELPAAVLPDG